MLQTVSWSTFLFWLFILTGLYYLGVMTLLYRRELVRLFRPKPLDDPFAPPPASPNATEKLRVELAVLFETAAHKKTIKEELMMALQMLLREYTQLKDSQASPEINRYIQNALLKTGSITLSDAEMKMLWNG